MENADVGSIKENVVLTQECGQPQYRYEAFISYRHVEPDMTIAARLHTLLETYVIPRQLRRDGRRTPGKVFRDEEELPVSENLSQDIRQALASSRFLIVICSKSTPLSRWCAKEIQEFQELNGGERILSLLIEGEPGEAFPEELRWKSVNADGEDPTEKLVREEVEPLAADIRAETVKESLRKLKKREVLRLLAPLLGVSFDDLYQRERRRKRRKAVCRCAAAAGLVLAAAAVLGISARKISDEKFMKQLEVSLARGENALEEGRRLEALDISMHFLEQYPKMAGYDENTASARKLLLKAAYIPANSLLCQINKQENAGQTSMVKDPRLSGDGRLLYIVNNSENQVEQYRVADGELEAEFTSENAIQTIMVHEDKKRLVIVYRNGGGEIVSLESGERLWQYEAPEHYEALKESVYYEEERDTYFYEVTDYENFSTCLAYMEAGNSREIELEEISPRTIFTQSGKTRLIDNGNLVSLEWKGERMEFDLEEFAWDTFQLDTLCQATNVPQDGMLTFAAYSSDNDREVTAFFLDMEAVTAFGVVIPLREGLELADLYVAPDRNTAVAVAYRGIYETELFVYYLDAMENQPYWQFTLEGRHEVEAFAPDSASFLTLGEGIQNGGASLRICKIHHKNAEILREDAVILQTDVDKGWTVCAFQEETDKAGVVNLEPFYLGEVQNAPQDNWQQAREYYISSESVSAGQTQAVKTAGSQVEVLDSGGRKISAYQGEKETMCFTLDEKNRYLIVCEGAADLYSPEKEGSSATIAVWDYGRNETVKEFDCEVPNGCFDMRLAPDGSRLYLASGGRVTVVDLEKEELCGQLRLEEGTSQKEAFDRRCLFDFTNERLFVFEYFLDGPAWARRIQPVCTLYSLDTGEMLLSCPDFAEVESENWVFEKLMGYNLVEDYGVVITYTKDGSVTGYMQIKPLTAVEEDAVTFRSLP